jgi:hypothetical protein
LIHHTDEIDFGIIIFSEIPKLRSPDFNLAAGMNSGFPPNLITVTPWLVMIVLEL